MDDTTLMQLRGVPLLFTFRQTATLSAGSYNFSSDTTANAFTPDRPISQNVLYIIKTISFAMDLATEDYCAAIDPNIGGVLPEFSMYVQSDGGAPGLREPIVLARYFERLPYLLPIIGRDLLSDAYSGTGGGTITSQSFNRNRLLGLIRGNMVQTASMLGKISITAILSFSAHEITDQNIVAQIQGRKGHGAGGKVFE